MKLIASFSSLAIAARLLRSMALQRYLPNGARYR
jgi:hypothetical protein